MLPAAIELAFAGILTPTIKRNLQIGDACSTAEITLPGYRLDLGSLVYLMGVSSPYK
jgi:phytoene dehydrogenase-like protein